MDEAITMIQTRKKQHKSLGTALTQPTKLDENDTTTLSYHPTSCAILPTMHTTKLSTCTYPIHTH